MQILPIVGLVLFTALTPTTFPSDPTDQQQEIYQKIQDREARFDAGEGELLSLKELEEYVMKTLEDTGEFDPKNESDLVFCSMVYYSTGELAVGYKPASVESVEDHLNTTDFKNNPEWQSSRNSLKTEIVRLSDQFSAPSEGRGEGQEEGSDAIKISDIVEQDKLPFVYINTKNIDLIKILRKNKFVNILEPMAFGADLFGLFGDAPGCGQESIAEVEDWTTIEPFGSKVPWHYKFLQIEKAWQVTQGAGTKVAMIDLGISPNQGALSSGGFAQGESQNRSITTQTTYYDNGPSPYSEECSHGTHMAGVLAAPKSGPSVVGIAYKSDFAAYKSADQVLLSSAASKAAVINAFLELADDPDVKVISMSMGYIISNSSVQFAVQKALNNDKLVLCAAGTSPSLLPKNVIIWPAKMNGVVAVTGVYDSWGTVNDHCSTCHYGDQVDFVVPVQRYGQNQILVPTLGMEGLDPGISGASSLATATMAGVATLVRTEFPNDSRSQIVERLRLAADFGNDRDDDLGWGIVNAEYAVKNIVHPNNLPPLSASITPAHITIGDSGTYTWEISSTNAMAPLGYSWNHETPENCGLTFSNCFATGNSYTCHVEIIGQNQHPAAVITAYINEIGYPSRTASAFTTADPGPIE